MTYEIEKVVKKAQEIKIDPTRCQYIRIDYIPTDIFEQLNPFIEFYLTEILHVPSASITDEQRKQAAFLYIKALQEAEKEKSSIKETGLIFLMLTTISGLTLGITLLTIIFPTAMAITAGIAGWFFILSLFFGVVLFALLTAFIAGAAPPGPSPGTEPLLIEGLLKLCAYVGNHTYQFVLVHMTVVTISIAAVSIISAIAALGVGIYLIAKINKSGNEFEKCLEKTINTNAFFNTEIHPKDDLILCDLSSMESPLLQKSS